MAANFWNSSHKKSWLFKKENLTTAHEKDKEQLSLTEEEICKIKVHHLSYIQAVGKSLSMRQRVIATAIVYFRRIYVKHNFVDFCPRLIAATSFYIAAKAEECSTQAPAYKVVNEMKKIDSSFPYTTKDILDCEIYMLEALEFNLIVYHPYRSIATYLNDCKLDKECLVTVWKFVNDCYATDLPLLFPPYIIALGCIYLASFVVNADLRLWFAELNVEMKEIWSVSNELLEYYERRNKEKKGDIGPILKKVPWYQITSKS